MRARERRAPRDFYLRKLQDSHIVIGIYRKSYGWIDEAKEMTVSGLEDEFREAQRLEKDFLAYVLKSTPDRDARLEAMVGEMMDGPHVLYLFDDGEDLEARFRDDLTALVTDRFTRGANPVADRRYGRARRSPPSSATVRCESGGTDYSINCRGPAALARTDCLGGQGASGAGKTALVAEWSHERRRSIRQCARHGCPHGTSWRRRAIEACERTGACNTLVRGRPLDADRARWRRGKGWPLVLDDPEDADAVWSVLGTFLTQSGTGSVVIVARAKPEGATGEELPVPGFTSDELVALGALAGASVPANPGDLPLLLRQKATAMTGRQRYDALSAVSREILGLLSLAPVMLTLPDMKILLGSAGSDGDRDHRAHCCYGRSPDGDRSRLRFHQWRACARRRSVSLSASGPNYMGCLSIACRTGLSAQGGLGQHLAFVGPRCRNALHGSPTGAASEAVFSGSTRHLTDVLDYLVDYYRSRSEKGRLVSVLIALGETRAHQGAAPKRPSCY